MPNAMTVDKINTTLSVEAVRGLAADDGGLLEQMSRPGSFLDVAQSLLDLGDEELSYLRSLPTVLQETIRAAVAEALAQGKAVQVQYSPGYDFAVRVWDYGQAVGIHLTGPYPEAFATAG